MQYVITSDAYADTDYSVTVNGPMVIAYGVANAITQQERITTRIVNKDGEVVQVIVPGK